MAPQTILYALSQVHIRYEDDRTIERPFAVGLTVRDISWVTTNLDWKASALLDLLHPLPCPYLHHASAHAHAHDHDDAYTHDAPDFTVLAHAPTTTTRPRL